MGAALGFDPLYHATDTHDALLAAADELLDGARSAVTGMSLPA